MKKQNNVRALIGYLSRVMYSADPDPAPLTLAPVVTVQPTQPVPLSALQQQSENAKTAMEEKRKRALSYLATHPVAARRTSDHAPARGRTQSAPAESVLQ